MCLLDFMFDRVYLVVYHKTRFFWGSVSVPANFIDLASDDTDDAAKSNLRNLHHTALELIKASEQVLEQFL